MRKEEIPTAQVLKEREDRHRRLMRLIKNHKPSSDEIKKLQKIKANTLMEINLRFLRSEHNRHYRFPKLSLSDSDEEEPYTPFQNKEPITYDLRTQNEVAKKSAKKNLLSLENTRRIKSLDRQKSQIQNDRLGRLHEMKDRQLSYKKLRKNSLSSQKKVTSHIKLPELKHKQKLKTQSKNDSVEIEKVIGKKLITQTEDNSKEGMHKYLKSINEQKNRKKIQNLFLKQGN